MFATNAVLILGGAVYLAFVAIRAGKQRLTEPGC
jgi:hypothetical protein